jgi:hypothetical protein
MTKNELFLNAILWMDIKIVAKKKPLFKKP